MRTVSFSTSIASSQLNPSESQPKDSASKVKPGVIHAKSEKKGENIQKRGFDLFRKLSTDKSRAHVGREVDKKIGANQHEESSTAHIKTRTHKKVSFSKSGPKNEPAIKSESHPVRKNPIRTRDELNLTYLQNGLKKVTKDWDDNKRNDLATGIRQLLGDLGGEPDKTTLVELKTVADKLYLIPEVKDASIALNRKIDEALSKKAGDVSQNLVKAEKIAMPALDGPMLSAKAEKLREPQPKPSAPDKSLDEFMAALDKSNDIDEFTAALEHREGVPLSADDELERELKGLNDMLGRT